MGVTARNTRLPRLSDRCSAILAEEQDGLIVRLKTAADDAAWDDFVHTHPDATVYHLSAWQEIIRRTYRHQPLYLMAVRNGDRRRPVITGIMPLFMLNSPLFGKSLVSIPFFDQAGGLYTDPRACEVLLKTACRCAEQMNIKAIELRQIGKPLLEKMRSSCSPQWSWSTKTDKVSLQLSLPETSDQLMKSFKSKLRSQIKNPMKKGLEARVGGKELLSAFYQVFCVNMRDLGSPVHSKRLMQYVLEAFPQAARIVTVHQNGKVLAGSLVIGFGKTLENPWASSLREYSRLNANMLLYWQMLAYACDNGYQAFNFGRSSTEEGTYKFKRQWGAEPKDLFWYSLSRGASVASPEKSHYAQLIGLWQKLPVPVANMIGPVVRKHISL
jgi:FemAB-related protein (PEP-CTERM system-associated)